MWELRHGDARKHDEHDVQSQKAVTAYWESKQLPPSGFDGSIHVDHPNMAHSNVKTNCSSSNCLLQMGAVTVVLISKTNNFPLTKNPGCCCLPPAKETYHDSSLYFKISCLPSQREKEVPCSAKPKGSISSLHK